MGWRRRRRRDGVEADLRHLPFPSPFSPHLGLRLPDLSSRSVYLLRIEISAISIDPPTRLKITTLRTRELVHLRSSLLHSRATISPSSFLLFRRSNTLQDTSFDQYSSADTSLGSIASEGVDRGKAGGTDGEVELLPRYVLLPPCSLSFKD